MTRQSFNNSLIDILDYQIINLITLGLDNKVISEELKTP